MFLPHQMPWTDIPLNCWYLCTYQTTRWHIQNAIISARSILLLGHWYTESLFGGGGVFYDAITVLDHIESNGRMVDEIERIFEGGHIRFRWLLSVRRDSQDCSQCSRCPGQDLNQTPPRQKFRALTVMQSTLYVLLGLLRVWNGVCPFIGCVLFLSGKEGKHFICVKLRDKTPYSQQLENVLLVVVNEDVQQDVYPYYTNCIRVVKLNAMPVGSSGREARCTVGEPARLIFLLLCRMSDLDNLLLQSLMDFVYQLLCSGDLTMAKALRVKIIEKCNAKRLYNASSTLLPSLNIYTR